MLSEVKLPSPLILKYSSEVVTKKNNPCGCCCEKTEVRLYPRLLVVRMLKASFKVRLWPISNGNAVMTYVGFRSKITHTNW